MPVETLYADRMVKQVSCGATFTSAMPFRILNKGPEYFRRQLEPNSKKLSAVERLEADKAKYVKSQQVASTKQEPVKPPLIKKALMSPGVLRTINTPTRKIPLGLRRGEGCGRRGALNIDILNNLINICDSPLSSSPSPKTETGGSSPRVNATWEKQPDGQAKLSGGYSNLSKVSPNSVTVRRVDVRPNAVQQHPKQQRQQQQQQQQFVRQTAPRVCNLIPPSSPAYTRISSTSSRSSKRGHPSLHRSKSDLSDRYSRATADLERFFNYCGLDPMEIESIGVERFARASSDIVSIKLPSVSTPSSEQSCQTEERASEREPYGISIIERNARVIKWLYGIRQAWETQKVSNV
ncbi:protein FAM110A-like [Acipenser ruthenus]|uniref:protein FAM110A-like n=1 Tax=Acipenser ruthenus TaxID=7906 RepID=UPI00145A7606|nr:protein FAM110A-like [Acipenser ruthenus]XP_058846810.1 protein FAM110A-like [Acipenser ruthenus]XP_058846811.1 protein FAM110A-like [Acipenser ruthenus]XP_058846812.1 protein FAM110A-like [Acipenser ruthenus]